MPTEPRNTCCKRETRNRAVRVGVNAGRKQANLPSNTPNNSSSDAQRLKAEDRVEGLVARIDQIVIGEVSHNVALRSVARATSGVLTLTHGTRATTARTAP